MQLSASARSVTLLPGRSPVTASKYPLQRRATRKALRRMRPRSAPRSFPKHWRKQSRRTFSLAVRFDSHKEVAKALSSWKGKTIVDVTNAYGVPPEQLGGQPSSARIVAE